MKEHLKMTVATLYFAVLAGAGLFLSSVLASRGEKEVSFLLLLASVLMIGKFAFYLYKRHTQQ